MVLVPFLSDLFLHPVIQLAAILSALGIGLFQGIVLGRAILVRFPRLQNHVKTVSVTIFVLFLINAILSVSRFASPDKISMSSLSASNPGEVASSLFLIFGVNTGFLTVLAISVTVMSFVLLKFIDLGSSITKWFVFIFSAFILILTGTSRFTDLTPSTFEVLLYFLYQMGITVGILMGTIRKIRPKNKT